MLKAAELLPVKTPFWVQYEPSEGAVRSAPLACHFNAKCAPVDSIDQVWPLSIDRPRLVPVDRTDLKGAWFGKVMWQPQVRLFEVLWILMDKLRFRG
ncbi:MAG: hypothetical protein JJ897_11995 [Marinibacterium sp.]|nr:hypothetical protein [Marinibacterium sp.]